jgi:hypothetical protein
VASGPFEVEALPTSAFGNLLQSKQIASPNQWSCKRAVTDTGKLPLCLASGSVHHGVTVRDSRRAGSAGMVH